jgi:hypothetical protein
VNANTISRRRATLNGTPVLAGKASSSNSICDYRVSCVRFSPNAMNPVIVSAGWDKVVKVSNSVNPPST